MGTGEGGSFSFNQVGDFDAHIAREIRGYETLDAIVGSMADVFLEDGTNMYDIGCSTGRFMNNLARKFHAESDVSRQRSVRFVGYEPSENLTKDFVPASEDVELRKERVDKNTTFENASLISSLFTLQFMPTHLRPQIIENIYKGLNPNGAFIWAEKVHASDAKLENVLNTQHQAFKREGSSADDILDKDLRLRGIMRPLTEEANRNMLANAGFTRFETFWRVNNFMATIALKSY